MRKLLNELLTVEYTDDQDRGIGLDPLLKEFVYDTMLPPEHAHKRVDTITSYYNEVLKRTKNVVAAYNITRKWAKDIYTPKTKKSDGGRENGT